MTHLPHLTLLTIIPEPANVDHGDQLPLLPVGPNLTLPEHASIPNQHGPAPPSPHHVNFAHHQQGHAILQKMMTIYFQEYNEDLPTIDPIHSA
jgi:hypothetical protein